MRERGFIERFAGALEFLARDDLHDFRGLCAAHDGGAGGGPGEDEVRIEAAAAHAVIARAIRAADGDGEFGNPGVGDGLDHFGTMLDGAAAFGLQPDHVAGGVLQEDERRAELVAGLDELRGFGGALRLDGAVIRDDAGEVGFDAGVAADGF